MSVSAVWTAIDVSFGANSIEPGLLLMGISRFGLCVVCDGLFFGFLQGCKWDESPTFERF